jgi:hypothetical protein
MIIKKNKSQLIYTVIQEYKLKIYSKVEITWPNLGVYIYGSLGR